MYQRYKMTVTDYYIEVSFHNSPAYVEVFIVMLLPEKIASKLWSLKINCLLEGQEFGQRLVRKAHLCFTSCQLD